MLTIVGRETERHTLDLAYQSQQAEFIAVFGRRRVGKTYLIRNHFAPKKDAVFFDVTGTKDGPMPYQIAHFVLARRLGTGRFCDAF